jgi:hypothetical protein
MWPNVFLLRLGGHPWAAFEAQPAAGSVWLDGWGGVRELRVLVAPFTCLGRGALHAQTHDKKNDEPHPLCRPKLALS